MNGERAQEQEEYEEVLEALGDLVDLINERDTIGGGPNFTQRWRAAYDRAAQLTGKDDGGDA